MPHDRDGTVIEVGDIVYVPAKVKAIHLTEDYCNLDLETSLSMPPLGHRTELHLNAKQVVKNCLDPRTAYEQTKEIMKTLKPDRNLLDRPMDI